MSSKVLVTGASGFIALHVVDQFLRAGHHVRGSVRALDDEKKVAPVRKLSQNGVYPLELVEADLLDAASWTIAVQGVDIVVHVASPFYMNPNSSDEEIIKPALEGTLNVLKAAQQAGVKRVVVTSSGLTIFGSTFDQKEVYTEEDWAEAESFPYAYGKSKVLAERAAWNFVEEKKKAGEQCFELAVIHPVFVLGPLLSQALGSSAKLFLSLFHNKIDKIRNMSVPTCDVRDVALAHLKAAFVSEAAGHRHMITSLTRSISMREWVDILKDEFSAKGYSFPSKVDDSGAEAKCTTAIFDDTRMRNVLGITPRDLRATIVDMANSVIELGITLE